MFRLLLLAGLVILIVKAIMSRIDRGSPRYKCVDCRWRRRLDDDGVICGFGTKETFKNAVHIANCTDYERDPGR